MHNRDRKRKNKTKKAPILLSNFVGFLASYVDHRNESIKIRACYIDAKDSATLDVFYHIGPGY